MTKMTHNLVFDLEDGEERFLGDLDRADSLHALLALLLLLQEFSFARDIAAVAFSEHVLAARLHRRPSDDLVANRTLDGNLEELTGNDLLELIAEPARKAIGLVLVNDEAEGIHLITRKEDVEFHEL